MVGAIAALVVALVSISLSAILVKFSELEVGPYATAFNRFWITALILGVWNVFHASRRRFFSTKFEQPEQPSSLFDQGGNDSASLTRLLQSSPYDNWVGWQLLVAGAFLAADLILWAWSLTQTSVANATLLANLTPVFTCLGGWLIWGRRFNTQFLVGMGIALAGTFVLGFSDLQIGAIRLQGDAAALLAAMFFGMYLLILEQLQSKLHPAKIILWSCAIASVLTLPSILMAGDRLFPISWQGWASVISLALVCQVIGQGLLMFSLSRISSEFVSLFLLLDPILAALGAWVLFSERLHLVDWLAFAVVLMGIYLASSNQSAANETTSLTSFAPQYNADAN
jgi:drug/metabolite transporter (DMT)-like permease